MNLRCRFEHDEQSYVVMASDVHQLCDKLAELKVTPGKWVSVYEVGSTSPIAKAHTSGMGWVET